MKKLLLIGGTMGVGKTTISQYLRERLSNAVFLDGDWCWSSSPFHVNDETKAMVLDNIGYVLNNFLHCSAYEHVLFCWVMHEQAIVDAVLSQLDLSNCEVYVIFLTASKEMLTARIMNDVKEGERTADVLKRSLAKNSLYQSLKGIKVNTNHKTVEEIAAEIVSLCDGKVHR